MANSYAALNDSNSIKLYFKSGQAMKSAFDIVTAFVVFFVVMPLLLLIAFLLLLDGGNIIFAHSRIGRGGRKFNCLKFRTMRTNGDALLARLLAEDPKAAAEWAASQKLRNDPRVTRIGRFLRVTSLDELPQLLNVLRGEMSLVGPRPIVQAEVPRYGHNIHHYMSVKPGLTGLWQVSGRSDTSYRQRVELDVEYVETHSFGGDLLILAKTVQVILMQKGSV